MDVHVNRLGREFKIQHAKRKLIGRYAGIVRLFYSRRHRAAFDIAVIDKKVLHVPIRAEEVRLGDVPAHADAAVLTLDISDAPGDIPPEQHIYNAFEITVSRCLEFTLPVRNIAYGDVRCAQCDLFDDSRDRSGLG